MLVRSPSFIPETLPFQPTPASRRGRSRAKVKEYGENILGFLGIAAIIISFVALLMIDPFTDFVAFADMFVVFVTVLLMSGLFIKYAMK